jgi:hypothetical protein
MQDFPGGRPRIGVRAVRPFFHDQTELRGASGSYDLFASRPVGDVSMFVSLSFNVARGRYESHGQQIIDFGLFSPLRRTTVISGNESALSSIGVGVQTHEGSWDRRSCVTLALYFPIANDAQRFTNLVGLYGDFYNLQRAAPEQFATYLNLAHRRRSLLGLFWGAEAGSQINVSARGFEQGQGHLHFGASLGAEFGRAVMLMEYLDIFDMTHSYASIRQRLTHFLAAGLHWEGNAVQPTLFAQLPIDPQLNDILDAVVGFKLQVSAP